MAIITVKFCDIGASNVKTIGFQQQTIQTLLQPTSRRSNQCQTLQQWNYIVVVTSLQAVVKNFDS